MSDNALWARDPAATGRFFWGMRVRGDLAQFARDEAAACSAWQRHPRLHWHAPDNWHMTLCFLGNTQAALPQTMAAELAVALAPLHAFVLQAGSACWFPSRARPLAIALPVATSPPLAALHAVLLSAAGNAGFVAGPRAFRGHITLARVRAGVHPATELPALRQVAFVLDEVTLFESVGHGEGLRYDALLSLPLRPAGGA